MYRFTLFRKWDRSLPLLLWCGLNPSTADALTDDPTVRRIRQFSKAWGYGGFYLVNLFAYRSTNPQVLDHPGIDDPVGRLNDGRIDAVIDLCRAPDGWATMICAWGVRGGFLSRDAKFLSWCRKRPVKIMCLKITKHGFPVHPLYQPRYLKPILYMGR